MTEVTIDHRTQTDTDFDWFGTGIEEKQEVHLPEHPEPYVRDEVHKVLYGEQRDLHSLKISEKQKLFLSHYTGLPYDGPVFMQGSDRTCTPWSLTHATIAVGVNPDVDGTTKLLNIASVDLDGNGGMYLPEASKLAKEYLPGVDVVLLPNLGTVLQDPSIEDGLYLPPEEHMKRIIREQLDNKKALVSVLSRKDQQTNKVSTHAVCITAYRIDAKNNMFVQVLDSATGPRVESVRNLTTKILDANQEMLSVAKSPIQMPQSKRNVGKHAALPQPR